MIDWHETNLILPKQDIHGNRITGLVMTGMLDGKRVYRVMTDAEQFEHLEATAW